MQREPSIRNIRLVFSHVLVVGCSASPRRDLYGALGKAASPALYATSCSIHAHPSMISCHASILGASFADQVVPMVCKGSVTVHIAPYQAAWPVRKVYTCLSNSDHGRNRQHLQYERRAMIFYLQRLERQVSGVEPLPVPYKRPVSCRQRVGAATFCEPWKHGPDLGRCQLQPHDFH